MKLYSKDMILHQTVNTWNYVPIFIIITDIRIYSIINYKYFIYIFLSSKLNILLSTANYIVNVCLNYSLLSVCKDNI